MAADTSLTQAWVDGVEVPCVQGYRFCAYEGETVVIGSKYDDGTAYVTATKTFPVGTLAAARSKWKTQNYSRHYGSGFGAGFDSFTVDDLVGIQFKYEQGAKKSMQEILDQMMRDAWKSPPPPPKKDF